MLYARQIEPQLQESPLFHDEVFFPDDIAVFGNRMYKKHVPEFFQRVYNALENGELAEALEDIETGGFYSSWYRNAEEVINDLLPPEKAKYNAEDICELKKLVTNYSCRNEEITLCSVLSIVTGKEWSYTTLRGCTQSEWNRMFYLADQWTDKNLDVFEIEYFNNGTEWIVHDKPEPPEKPEDISGYSVYCTSWDTKGIRQELAEASGEEPENIVMYDYDIIERLFQTCGSTGREYPMDCVNLHCSVE